MAQSSKRTKDYLKKKKLYKLLVDIDKNVINIHRKYNKLHISRYKYKDTKIQDIF